MSRVAVIGNTARAIGAVCASDLTLSGHEVRYTVFPEQRDQLPEVRKAGGFTVEGDAKDLISKKTGFARGAVVHVQSHGYWPAARLTPLLRNAGREDVLVTEARSRG